MHPKAWRRVHFDNRTADVLVRLGDILDEEIDAAHIQSHGHDRALGHVAIVGVDHIREVDRRAPGGQVCR